MYSKMVSSLFSRQHSSKVAAGAGGGGGKKKGAGPGQAGAEPPPPQPPAPSPPRQQQPEAAAAFSATTEKQNCLSEDIRNLRHGIQMHAKALTWEVTYIGSFPLGAGASLSDQEHVIRRLDQFRARACFRRRVQLSINGHSIKISDDEAVLLNHPLRRVQSVIGRPSQCQVAYVATEPSGSLYRRQCHLFQADDDQQVLEIENIMDRSLDMSEGVVGRHSSATPATQPVRVDKRPQSSYVKMPSPPVPLAEKRHSSSAFLSRLLGSSSSSHKSSSAPQPRRPESDSSSDDIGTDPKAKKRRRRPVSAVFSQAIHRLSSSTSIHHKRMSTVDIARGGGADRCGLFEEPFRVPANRVPSQVLTEDTSPPPPAEKAEKAPAPTLVYDDKLKEWFYPVDEALEQQLAKVAYFVRNPQRHVVYSRLLVQPQGAFVVRSSERRRQLALSLRVSGGVSHFLLIRDDGGFRLKGGCRSFPSLQMLVTHYSVLREHLPCPLVFVDWQPEDWQDSGNKDCKDDVFEPDENRNSLRAAPSQQHAPPPSVVAPPTSTAIAPPLPAEPASLPVGITIGRPARSTSRPPLCDYRHSRIIDPDLLQAFM